MTYSTLVTSGASDLYSMLVTTYIGDDSTLVSTDVADFYQFGHD